MATTTTRSATRCTAHIDRATAALAAAAGHLAAAREAEPDPARDADYRDLLATIGKVSTTARQLRNGGAGTTHPGGQ